MAAMALPITPKMAEAIMWGVGEIGDRPDRSTFGPDDPLERLDALHPRDEIVEACGRIEERLFGHVIDADPTPVERDVLRLCVECTGWLRGYVEAGLSPAMMDEALDALDDLAGCLALIGIADVVPMAPPSRPSGR